MAHNAAVRSNAEKDFMPQYRCITGGGKFCRVGVFTTGFSRSIAFKSA